VLKNHQKEHIPAHLK